MKYELFFQNPSSQLIHIKLNSVGEEMPIRFHLPKWRPGRYELQQFDRLVSDFSALDNEGNSLPVHRVSTHAWEVSAPKGQAFSLEYNFYADRPDGGGSWFDAEYIYINGVNLFLYRKDQMLNPHELFLHISDEVEIACGLEREGNLLKAKDFHQLVDAPILASPSLHHTIYYTNDIPLHLWFAGQCKPDFERLTHDFELYSQAQMDMFGEFPVDEYHFLFVARPIHSRHGVEHYNSTVIAMGPGPLLMTPPYYESLMEIASHELFHTWNVKALRPAEMYPYDYDRENYSSLHYVTEGITTYYGDLMLWKGNFWGFGRWIQSINGELQTHFHKGGKDFVSLTEASFGSWTNGYHSEGIPNRKISFYTKGYLVAFLTDLEIRRRTANKYCLDDVVAQMYHQVAKNNRGYTKTDYLETLERFGGSSFEDFFQKYISGTESLVPALEEAAAYYGLHLSFRPLTSQSEARFGLKLDPTQYLPKIENILPNSPAEKAGLAKGDEIVSLNGLKANQNIQKIIQYFDQDEMIEVHYFHHGELQATYLLPDNSFAGQMPQFQILGDPNERQKENRKQWQSVKKYRVANVEESHKA